MELGLFLNDNCEEVAWEATSFHPGYAMMQMREAGQTLREEARVKMKSEAILSGLDLIKAYRDDPGKFFPMVDHPGQMPAVNTYGEKNLGWNAGIINGNRPWFVECWDWEGLTMLTFYISSEGLENLSAEDLSEMLQETGYYRENDPVRKHEVQTFNDRSGNGFYSLTVRVSYGEDVFIEGGNIYRWELLNEYNAATLGKD